MGVVAGCVRDKCARLALSFRDVPQASLHLLVTKVMVTLGIACEACLLTVLVGFIVLLPILEQTMLTAAFVRADFFGIVPWSKRFA